MSMVSKGSCLAVPQIPLLALFEVSLRGQESLVGSLSGGNGQSKAGVMVCA